MLPWWRLSWEQGHKGKNVDPPTPPDQQQRSRSARTAGPVAATLPPGEFNSVRYHRCLVRSNLHVIAPPFVCDCPTSFILSRVRACTVRQDVCMQISVSTVLLSTDVYVAVTLLLCVPV